MIHFVVLSLLVTLVNCDVSGYSYPKPQQVYGYPQVPVSGSTFYQTAAVPTYSSTVRPYTYFSTSSPYSSGNAYSTSSPYSSGNAFSTSIPVSTVSPYAAYYSQGFHGLGSKGGYQTVGNLDGYQTVGNLGGYQTLSSGVDLNKYNNNFLYQNLGANFKDQSYNLGFNNAYQTGQTVHKHSGFGHTKVEYVQQQPTAVFKHVYVHTAPDEPEIHQRQQIVIPPAQKHYKIIFIKTPNPAPPVAPVVPVLPQNEEKTIVYVLYKKPEDAEHVVVPEVAPTPPAKPEVYFIKYDGKKEDNNGQGTINQFISEIAHKHGAIPPGVVSSTNYEQDGVLDATSGSSNEGVVLDKSQYGSLSYTSVVPVSTGSSFVSGSSGSSGYISSGLSPVSTTSFGVPSVSVSAVNEYSSTPTPVVSTVVPILETSSTPVYSTSYVIDNDAGSRIDASNTIIGQGLPFKTYGLPAFRSEKL